MVRRLTTDQEIAGSNPASVTIFFLALFLFSPVTEKPQNCLYDIFNLWMAVCFCAGRIDGPTWSVGVQACKHMEWTLDQFLTLEEHYDAARTLQVKSSKAQNSSF